MAEKKKAEAREDQEQIKAAYRRILSGPDGEVVRSDLEYYANKQSHAPGDSHQTAFNDGMRVMARNWLAMAGEAQ